MRLRSSSLGTKFAVFFLVVTIPLAVLLVFQSLYAIQVVHDQVAESESKTLVQDLDRIDSFLGDLDKYLAKMIASDTDLLILAQGRLDDQYQFSKIQVSTRFTNDSLIYPSLGAFYFYDPTTDEAIVTQGSAPPMLELGEKAAIKRFLADKGKGPTPGWILAKIGSRDYLFRILKIETALVGAWVDVGTLVGPWVRSAQKQHGRLLLVDGKGTMYPEATEAVVNRIDLGAGDGAYRLSGTPVRYLVLGAPSTKGPFRLVALLPDDRLLQSLPTVRNLNTLVTAAIVLLLLVFFLFLHRTVLKPLKQLTDALDRLKQGDFETRIITAESSREFGQVNATFNSMVAKIHELRISVYEEQLHAHQAELMFLRLQINPHFFLNSLNIVYQLAQTQNYALIQDLTLNLSQYFQFLFRSSADFVKLEEEWNHVKTYLRIQELRFPGTLTCRFETPSPLPDIAVPPLLVQPFVENAVQHAHRPDGTLELTLKIEEEGTRVRITVADTGPGLSVESLAVLNADPGMSPSGDHVGVANVRRRLKLLYGAEARLTFANQTPPLTGMVVTLEVPSDIAYA